MSARLSQTAPRGRSALALALAAAVATAALGRSQTAAAADLGEDASLEVHGFVSQGYVKTTENNYLTNTDADRGSVEFSDVGVNFTAQLSERLRVGMQLFSRDLGPTGNYSVKADWYYLDYRFRDALGFRLGRVKIPFGLYNDVSDVDAAYVPVLLPQSVYPVANRDALLAQTGGEVYGYAALGPAGAIDYRIYGGTIYLPLNNMPGSPLQISAVTVPYVVGGRLLWELPVEGLRAGGAVQALRFDTTVVATGAPAPISVSIPALLWVASLEYAAHDLLLAAEYSRWHLESESSDVTVFPNTTAESERGYALAAYRVRPWLQPGVYYSVLFPDVNDRDGRESFQHDAAGTFRFDVGAHWLVKLEGHYMRGTAALNPVMNGGVARAALPDAWGVFLAKVTAYF